MLRTNVTKPEINVKMKVLATQPPSMSCASVQIGGIMGSV
jgi:hypothetical protein